ncbi:predicted protein [Naegleria gruberi]|uniref:Predicted protein n=1 Tax=Naegleria gruberi TaxID=5762 RepID=D2VJA0_NAEGR|nr:uncharacterized protein NAEGRDRAFT_68963 [Naegleria gruberi]EFC43158.1 predicted protein [Naegleria gruberi]|eukprot:XP_002675902.1 predicted protein [Naegleria gruberi strain NEG-M]
MQAQYGAFQAAVEMGFYDNECLNVVIKLGGPNADPIAVIKSGEAQLGVFLYSRVLVNRELGLDFVNIFQHYSRGGLTMVSRTESEISTFPQFKGKNIGYWVGNDYSLLATMKKYNIDTKTEMSLRLQSFSILPLLEQPERYDVIMAMGYDQLGNLLMTAKKDSSGKPTDELYSIGRDLNILDFNAEQTAMLEDCIVMNKAWYDTNPIKNKDILVRFLKATIKGLITCRDYETKCFNLMPDKSAHQVWSVREVNKLIWPANLNGVGWMNTTLLNRTIDVAYKFGVINSLASANGSYDSQFVEEAMRQFRKGLADGSISDKYSDLVAPNYGPTSHEFCYDVTTDTVFICNGKLDTLRVTVLVVGIVLGSVMVMSAVLGLLAIAFGFTLLKKRRELLMFAPTEKDESFPIVFTDIQQSTKLWNAFPEEMKIALELHNQLLRRLLDEYEGYECKSQGDGLMVAFRDPINALKWMLRSQVELMKLDWPEHLMDQEHAKFEVDNVGKMIFRGLRVRMGGGMCKPDVKRDKIGRIDYLGNDVNQAARVGSIAVGGQIVIHQNLYEEVSHKLTDLIIRGETKAPPFNFLGFYMLKGIDGVHALYDILPASIHFRKSLFPPIFDEAKGLLIKELEETAIIATTTDIMDEPEAQGSGEKSSNEI